MDGAEGEEHVLRFPAGSTLFASGYEAFELSDEAERQHMLALQARYSRGWGSLTNQAGQDDDEHEDEENGDGPLMDGSGTRRLQRPWYADDTGARNAERFDCVLPLVLRHPHTGRHSVFCEPIAMVQLEPELPGDGSNALSWDESHDIVSRAWRRATVPERVLVWDWRPNDVILWDSRCIMHSRTPYKLYAPAEADAPRGSRLMHNMRIAVELGEAGVQSAGAKL